MSEPRNVTLEFLRHGPPHNQLLSPLTRYLALCGNHSSVTVEVPYEHAQFLARQKVLSYEGELQQDRSLTERALAKQNRELQLQWAAQEISGMLAQIPPLISELKAADEQDDFTHFEIVLSAQELALLPFELALAPPGCPGDGQTLALQSQSPLCITRRVRRVDNELVKWPDGGRILFVEALPPDDAEVLVPAHMLALRRAIDPWVGADSTEVKGPAEQKRRGDNILTVLRNASVEDISSKLRDGDYTHLHILAHGVECIEGVDKRFALRLRSARNRNEWDDVSSSRLMTIVRSFVKNKSHTLSLPAVVTLASCNGANGGSVIGAGASIAHGLHEAGIPLVIGSQFPLSFAGSVLMVEVLYRGLLWGEDPRVLLNNLRRQLKYRLPDTHDWASLIAYAGLPSNISAQSRNVQYEQALRCIDTAFSYSDEYSGNWNRQQQIMNVAEAERMQTQLAVMQKRLSRAETYLRQTIEDLPGVGAAFSIHRKAMVYGRLASMEKRKAEVEFYARWHPDHFDEWIVDKPQWEKLLAKSRDYYQQAFTSNRLHSWALVSDIAISIVLGDPPDELRAKWETAQFLSSELDLHAKKQVDRACAISNLIELQLVSLWFSDEGSPWSRAEMETRYNDVRARVLDLCDELTHNVDEKGWEIVSRRRQSTRYIHWFYQDDLMFRDFEPFETFPDDVPYLIKGLCQEILDRLPEKEPQELHGSQSADEG